MNTAKTPAHYAGDASDTHCTPPAGSAVGPTPERYRWAWHGVTFDFYRLCEILGIHHHAQAHALKKLIRAGRSVKSIDQDIDETIDALRRWKEMLTEDRQNVSVDLTGDHGGPNLKKDAPAG